MPSKEVIEIIKQFIENPNAENVIETARTLVAQHNFHMCALSGCRCSGCIWESACPEYEPDGNITDEEISAMVLDAIRTVAISEARMLNEE